MLGRIAAVTLSTPDLPGTLAAYQRWLGYRPVDDRALGRDTARLWGRAGLGSQRTVILEPESGADTYLRLVEGATYPEYEPLGCVGWNAAELVVSDVDALAGRLEGSPFRAIGAPADLSFSDRIRAMQVVGPAGEVLYLTQIKERLAAFDTPEAASFVDRVFIVILGGTSLPALQDYYHQQFGVPRAPVLASVVSVLSAKYGLPREHRHAIAALPLAGQCYLEADQMPEAVRPRPCAPGQLPPAIAIVSFEIDRLPEALPGALAPPQVLAGLPYAGRRAALCIGADGEWIELIEAG